MTRLIASLLAAAAVLSAPLAARAAPPVWTLHGKDSTVVLFGSVHILVPGQDWEPKALKDALAKADDLWFEIPMDEAGQLAAAQAAVQKGMLPPDQKLSALLDAKTRAQLARVAAKLNVSMDLLDRLQPWLADATLSDTALAAQGARMEDGVEETLQKAAPPTIQRHAFETAEGQLGMLAGASRTAQLASLKDTLRTIEDDPGDFSRLVSLWMKGDVSGLDTEAVEELRKTSPELYDILIKRRNTAWVDLILARLRGKGETVMVVGVGHLVGPDSVPALLRARGIKVDGP